MKNFIDGDSIYLRALNENDVNGPYSLWLNDPIINEYNSHGRFPISEKQLLDYVISKTKSSSDLVLALIAKDSNKHIGNISLQNINWIDKNAEIAFLLGDLEYTGKGIMFQAGTLLINHGFKVLNLNRIYCGTSSKNIGMQKLAKKLNMNKEGVRKEAIYKNGKYIDIIEYGILSKII